MPFKIDFDIKNYKDIYPTDMPEEKDIINYQHYGKPDKCIWQPETPQILTGEYKEKEITRVLRTGAWMVLKDELVWLPPNYYFALKYGTAGDGKLEFRLKRLKHVYEKIRARKSNAIGTFTIKNRGDGETTMSITDGFHQCLDGNMNTGLIGIQSKTRADAMNPCWYYAKSLWLNLPTWVKNELCSDFANGDNIAQNFKFIRPANEIEGKAARNIIMEYFPAVFNAMDGKHNMKICILDEVCKWIECSFYDTLINYKKFIIPGAIRKGLFDIFSSPSDIDNDSNKEASQIWDLSDPNEVVPETGTTKSMLHRIYSNPLDGIDGCYDQYGDADPQQIYDRIMSLRKNTTKEKLLGEVRAYPLNRDEMFASHEGGNLWDNGAGIKERKLYLTGRRFKDEKTKEPVKIFGNLEWKDGVIDHPEGQDFRQADVSDFDVDKARFCFSFLPVENLPQLEDIHFPPDLIESCLGVDPFGKRYKSLRFSNGAMVNYRFGDIMETGIVRCPTMTYCNRPQHEDTFYEDCIKAAIFNRAMIQYENVSDRLAGYVEDRGYHAWLLPSIGQKRGSLKTGDAPKTRVNNSTGGSGTFFNEGVRLLNALMNVPLKPGDPYWLERNWHVELLEDALKLNEKDTHEQDLTMAWIQAVVGAAKMMYRKIREPHSFNNNFVDSFFS